MFLRVLVVRSPFYTPLLDLVGALILFEKLKFKFL